LTEWHSGHHLAGSRCRPFRSGKWRVNLPIPDLLLFLGPPIAFRPPVRSIRSVSYCVNAQRQVPRSRHFGNWLRPKIPLLGPPLSLLYSHIAAAVAFRQSRTRQQKLVLQTLINGILSKWVTRVAASCGDHARGGIMNIWEVLLLVALVIGGIYYFRKRE